MEIDKDDLGRDLLQQLVGGPKRIVMLGHEHAALQIDDGVLLPAGQLTLVKAMPGSARDVVRGAQHPPRPRVAFLRNRLHIFDDFALVPHVVASGEDVGAVIEKLVRNARREAKPAGRIFSIDHHQVNRPLLYERCKMFADNTPPRLAKNVTYKQNLQKITLRPTLIRKRACYGYEMAMVTYFGNLQPWK